MSARRAVIAIVCAGIGLAGCSSQGAASSGAPTPATAQSSSAAPTTLETPPPTAPEADVESESAAPAETPTEGPGITEPDFQTPNSSILAAMTPQQMSNYVRKIQEVPQYPQDDAPGAAFDKYSIAYQRLQGSVTDSLMEAAGATYQVYAVDLDGIGPDKPVRIAFIPKGPNQQTRRLTEPIVYDSAKNKVSVTCAPMTIPTKPTIVTCTPKREAARADLVVGVKINATHSVASYIELNRGYSQ